MHEPTDFGATQEAKLHITAEALSDSEQCQKLQAAALQNLAFYQADRRSLAASYANALSNLAAAKAKLDEKKSALEYKMAETRDSIVSAGMKLTVSALDDKATLAARNEVEEVNTAKSNVGQMEAEVARVQENLSALKQVIEVNQSIVIATMGALKQYRDLGTYNA